MNSYCLGIVTYKPSTKIIPKLKIALQSDLDVYVYDNSPSKDDFFCELNSYDNFKSFKDTKNTGLGYAMKQLCIYANKYGYDGLLYFDQDTNFTIETLQFVEKFHNTNQDTFIKSGSFFFNSKSSSIEFKKRKLVHNNGTLFNLKKLKQINWYDENFFLDCVDYKYCLDCELSSHSIVEVRNTPGLDHLTDQDNELIPIFGKKFSLARVYSKDRLYDTLSKSCRIFYIALKNYKFYFAMLIFRFLIIYSLFQIYSNIYTYINETLQNKAQ